MGVSVEGKEGRWRGAAEALNLVERRRDACRIPDRSAVPAPGTMHPNAPFPRSDDDAEGSLFRVHHSSLRQTDRRPVGSKDHGEQVGVGVGKWIGDTRTRVHTQRRCGTAASRLLFQ